MPVEPQMPPSLHLQLLPPSISTLLILAKSEFEIRCQNLLQPPLPKYLRSHLTRHRRKERRKERGHPKLADYK